MQLLQKTFTQLSAHTLRHSKGPFAVQVARSANRSGMSASASMKRRPVTKLAQGINLSDGAGVPLKVIVGGPELSDVDPFLALAEHKGPASTMSAGFPDHPHRGLSTCTYIIDGSMEHADSVGNKGVVGPGGVQWMTAGRGIVHSEFPKAATPADRHWSFQLWINLSAKDKMMRPRYQDLQGADIPMHSGNGTAVTVIAGQHKDTVGPIDMRNPSLMFDVQLDKGAEFVQEVPQEWHAFAYVMQGSGQMSGSPVPEGRAVVFGQGDHITASSSADGGMRFLLIAGKPLNEPVARRGPFVINTEAEIQQAIRDYHIGRLQSPDDEVWKDWDAQET